VKSGWVLCLLLGIPAFVHAQSRDSAMKLVTAGLDAMGGHQRIRDLAGIHFEASVVRNALEQSERPEGPYIVESDQIEEWRGLKTGAWKRSSKAHVAMQPEFDMTVLQALRNTERGHLHLRPGVKSFKLLAATGMAVGQNKATRGTTATTAL